MKLQSRPEKQGKFQSTRLSRASTRGCGFWIADSRFQSTRLSRASTVIWGRRHCWRSISIHKALASLDTTLQCYAKISQISIHKALASLDHLPIYIIELVSLFQSTRLSRASTLLTTPEYEFSDFNPQGSREPRRPSSGVQKLPLQFQSTRLSRASTQRLWTG